MVSDVTQNEDVILRMQGVSFGYRSRTIIDAVDLEIRRGTITVILGPSGCGKSTLLGLIGGRLKPRAGKVVFDGVSVADQGQASLYRLRRKMGMLFQHSALLTDFSVFDNVAFPIRENTDLPEKPDHHSGQDETRTGRVARRRRADAV